VNDSVKANKSGLPVATSPEEVYSFGPFRLDVKKRRLWRSDQVVALTPKALETLLALVRQAGQVMDKDDLLKTVWPDTFVSEETLTQNISTLRKVLGDTSERPEYIATVPRRGYQFIGDVTLSPSAEHSQSANRSRPAEPAVVEVPEGHLSKRPERVWKALAAASLLISLSLGVAHYLTRSSSAVSAVSRWQIYPPQDTTLASAGVLSPDGRYVAFVTTNRAGSRVLQVRALESVDVRELPGTEGAREPFWSPDSRSLAFRSGPKLKRIDLSDQAPRVLGEIRGSTSAGTWSQAGIMVFPADKGPLYRMDDNGGTITPATSLAAGENAHVWPCFLPDGRHFLYRVVGASLEQSGTYIGSLDSDEKVRILDGSSSAAVYAPPGYLLFVRDETLVAQRFDPDRRQPPDGPLLPIAANVAAPDSNGRSFSAAAGGIVAYVTGGIHDELVWFDRAGGRLGVLEGSADFKSPALSHDDAKVFAMRLKNETDYHIWLSNSTGGTPALFDTGLSRSGQGLWSPNDTSMVFMSGGDLYRMPAHPLGPRELLRKNEGPGSSGVPQDWSLDGRFLVYLTVGLKTGPDLWSLRLADHKAEPILNTPADEFHGQFSPDVHWIAYASNDSGALEVFVQPFPAGGDRIKVSLQGGAQPRWRRDGRELFYLAADYRLMSVDVQPGPRFGTPKPLFHTQVIEELRERRDHYAVNRDGTRFLVSTPRPVQPPITILLNWPAATRP